MGDHRTRPGTAGHPTTVDVVIPWRDSGDPDRQAAFAYTHAYYLSLDVGNVHVCDDGKTEGAFNRHAAYNHGLDLCDSDVILWVEADTLIPLPQILTAAKMAADAPGLVVPYTERHELDATQTAKVYAEGADPFTMTGAVVYGQGRSIGQAGVTSRHTIDLIGGKWDDRFEGWGYDDNAAFRAFETMAGKARWVAGDGIHLWHLPAFVAPTPEQAAATARNAELFHAG